MSPPSGAPSALDKTNFAQSLMHMIKGNLGTGILAMPASFAHTGLVNAALGLPLLCLVATYCVHLLISSSERLLDRSKGAADVEYANLAKQSFRAGPNWMRRSSGLMSAAVDATLLVAQLGVCSVYLVFVVDNLKTILATYSLEPNPLLLFLLILPVALLLSYIRTLRRLAIASACANLLQAVGISFILEYLMRDLASVDLHDRDNFRPFGEAALGFGSAMFAFEGISVVLPVFARMKEPRLMAGTCGVVNISYALLLLLYFLVGLFGYLKYGHAVRDSITLSLPPLPTYDMVRAMFAVSVFLTYPLQFYVPQEIIWNWIARNYMPAVNHSTHLSRPALTQALDKGAIKLKPSGSGLGAQVSAGPLPAANHHLNGTAAAAADDDDDENAARYARLVNFCEYVCRTGLVLFTFALAICIPRLNLLMDFIGSVTGTMLSLIMPAAIHLAVFWDDPSSGRKSVSMALDLVIMAFGFGAGASGAFFSMVSIVNSFK